MLFWKFKGENQLSYLALIRLRNTKLTEGKKTFSKLLEMSCFILYKYR